MYVNKMASAPFPLLCPVIHGLLWWVAHWGSLDKVKCSMGQTIKDRSVTTHLSDLYLT